MQLAISTSTEGGPPSIETPKPADTPRHTMSSKIELPPGWERAEDEMGDVYFYNEETGETTWYMPTANALEM